MDRAGCQNQAQLQSEVVYSHTVKWHSSTSHSSLFILRFIMPAFSISSRISFSCDSVKPKNTTTPYSKKTTSTMESSGGFNAGEVSSVIICALRMGFVCSSLSVQASVSDGKVGEVGRSTLVSEAGLGESSGAETAIRGGVDGWTPRVKTGEVEEIYPSRMSTEDRRMGWVK